MTATTSKLGAAMNEELILDMAKAHFVDATRSSTVLSFARALLALKLGAGLTGKQWKAIETGIAAMEKCGWPQRVPVLRALLACQPAPLDKETVQGYAFRSDGKLWVVTDPAVAMKWQEQGFEVTPVNAAPLGKEAGKPAAPNVEVSLISALGEKYCPPTGKPRYDWLSPTSVDRADLEAEQPAAPSVEQDERGAFEVAMTEAGYHKPERSPFSGDTYKYERDQDRFVGFQLARASTSANVAQGAEAGWDAKGIKLTHSQRVAISQFLSDVMTAAGLISHGKQCKALGERLGERCMALHTLLDGQSATPLAMPSEEEVIAAAEYNWSTVSFDENGDSIYHFEKDYLQRFVKSLFAAAEEKQYASADAIDAEIHRLLELKIERFPEYSKSLLEGYATKVEVFDHMIKVAQAAGFESLTEAISVAKKSRANVAQGAAIAIRPDQIAEIANKYALGNPRLDALLGFVNEVIIVNGAEYAKSE